MTKQRDSNTECTFMKRVGWFKQHFRLIFSFRCKKLNKATKQALTTRMSSASNDVTISLSILLGVASVTLGVCSLVNASQCDKIDILWGCVKFE